MRPLRLPPSTRLPCRCLLLPLLEPRLRFFLIRVRLLRDSFGRQHRRPRLRIRPRRALVFKQALKAGFQRLIFEDNYDTGTGDHYSLRWWAQLLEGWCNVAWIRVQRKRFWEKAVDVDDLCGMDEAWCRIKGLMFDDSKATSYAEHFQNSRFVESVLEVYWEFPPVAGPSLTHQTRYGPACAPDTIIEEGRFGVFQRLGITRFEASVFNGYTQMLYLQISSPTLLTFE